MIWPDTLFHIDPHDSIAARGHQSAGQLDPQRTLRLEVLLAALEELGALQPPHAQRWQRAKYEQLCGWFASNATDWPFAFVPLCEALGLDPAAVRRTLPRQSYG